MSLKGVQKMAKSCSRRHVILVVSDGTGATAERVTDAAALQFVGVEPLIERRSSIRTRDQVSEVIREACDRAGMVVHTLVSAALRRHLYMEANSYGVIAVDLLGGILNEMSRYLEQEPQIRPGLLYGDERYFRRVDALEYAVRHDDGQSSRDLDRADIVLVGVSRTSKTPLSIFLAYRGYYVANFPIVLDMPLPAVLQEVPSSRIVGMTVNPHSMVAIREARLRQYPGLSIAYADIDHIRRELRYSREIFSQHDWPIIDVSGKAVEETAREVLNLVSPDERGR